MNATASARLFPIDVYGDDGKPFRLRVPADTAQEAIDKAKSQGWTLCDESLVLSSAEAVLPPVTKEGKALADTAMTLAFLGLVIPFCSIVAIVMAGMAKEKSKGVHGASAQAFACVSLVVSAVIVFLLIAASR